MSDPQKKTAEAERLRLPGFRRLLELYGAAEQRAGREPTVDGVVIEAENARQLVIEHVEFLAARHPPGVENPR